MPLPEQIPPELQRAAEELPTLYSDPLHYDVLAQMTAPNDLPFYRRLLSEGDSVLELGCGTGRIALELARDHEVVGVELAPEMLAHAEAKGQRDGIDILLALGDIRKFSLKRTFDFVLLPYNTLNHLSDVDSLRGCFETVRKHMLPSSKFVIDTFQPSLEFLGGTPEEPRQILRYKDPFTQAETRILEENHYDSSTQTNRIIWRYLDKNDLELRREDLTMRLFFPAELDALLALSGFVVEEKLGDYEGAAFEPSSAKQLIVARLEPAP